VAFAEARLHKGASEGVRNIILAVAKKVFEIMQVLRTLDVVIQRPKNWSVEAMPLAAWQA